MTVQLTEQQEKAVSMAHAISKMDNGAPAVGILGGYAGTGKTTTLETISREIQCVLLAPTGKAATRITDITGIAASTIHRWMYEAEMDQKTGQLRFFRKEPDKIYLTRDRLVVVDEASMISREVWQDLLETCNILKANILLVGDAFQLPPISKDPKDKFSVFSSDFVYDKKVMLTEILRQAAESPIIRISNNIRNGDINEAYEELNMLDNRDEFDNQLFDTMSDDGMLICYTNEMRHHLNNYFRAKIKLGPVTIGEPILVLKNNYAVNVFNGETFNFEGKGDSLGNRQVYCHINKHEDNVHFYTTMCQGKEVIIGEEVLEGKREKLSTSALEKDVSYWARSRGISYLHCNFGYALTCHKAQGHQAGKVIVVMQKHCKLWSEEGRRWLYTAVTRATDDLVLFHADDVSELPIPLLHH